MDFKSKEWINNYYTKRLQEYGISKEALVYSDDIQMRLRYAMMTDIVNIRHGDSVLDIGCRLGFFCDFLRDRGFVGQYSGYDINPDLIDACKQRLPNDSFKVIDILNTNNVEEIFDYVFCMATLQIKPRFCDIEEYFKGMVTQMFSRCTKGLAFDLFNIRNIDYQNDDVLYLDPIWVLEFCYSLTRRVIIRSDTRPFEFVVYMLKESDTNEFNIYNDALN